MTTYPAPSGRTAHRLEWPFLPPNLRAYIERKCGSPVVDAESQGAGFTPGFASVLTCEDGSRHFVKAASMKAQKAFAVSYREEARKLAALPESVPAPRLRWLLDDDWVVLGLDYVEGRHPGRPWRQDDLDACLDACEVVAGELTPAPASLALDTIADEFADMIGFWDHIRATQPGLPHLEEAAALAGAFADVATGDTVVHTDLRDDNFLIG
ncbi:MAG: hypothetical protein ACRDOZ_06090, partial [Nocardioides sp.]